MNIDEAKTALDEAQHVLILQAENPDGDSLASALALEHILGDLGKDVSLFCPVQMPRHLRYLSGWDRVSDELPTNFDCSILVDTSSESLLEQTLTPNNTPRLKAKPLVVLDHHATESTLPLPSIDVFDEAAVSTGELIYEFALEAGWEMNKEAKRLIASSIMSDSLGLTTDATTPRSIRIIADLVEGGVSLAELDEQRRALMKRHISLTHYKGELLRRIDIALDSQLALLHIPWEEIQEYSDQYNPSMLALDDMRMTDGVKVAIVFKTYPDGKLTAKIRANYGFPIAHLIAEHFGGGGHPYAAGFKVRDQELAQIEAEVKNVTRTILQEHTA